MPRISSINTHQPSPAAPAGTYAGAAVNTTAPAAHAATDGYTNATSGSSTPTASISIPSTPLPKVGALDAYNDPKAIVPNANMHFDSLPKSGKTAVEPWSGYYWPKATGGISYRWRTDESHTYEIPNLDKLKTMSANEIANLSPTEKYDIFVGSYQFPLTRGVQSANSADTPSWQGYCHGWTQAAIHFKEPSSVTLTNEDGISIPFFSSDIKALLTYFQGDVVRSQFGYPFVAKTQVIGGPNPGAFAHDPRCYDINPGGFHALLGNLVANGTAFGIDCDNGAQKWNQPVHSYNTQVLERRAPDRRACAEAVEEVVVKSDVSYAIEIHPQETPANENGHQVSRTDTYHYTLELDAQGSIVGGQWLTPTNAGFRSYHDVLEMLEKEGLNKKQIRARMVDIFRFPDYAYTQEKAPFAEEFKPVSGPYAFLSNDKRKLHSYFAKLKDIYQAST